MSLAELLLDRMDEVVDFKAIKAIPPTLPLNVMETFHVCERGKRCRAFLMAYLQHKGEETTPRMATLGQLYEMFEALRDNELLVRTVLEMREQQHDATTDGPGIKGLLGRSMADVPDDSIKAFAQEIVVGSVHTMMFVKRVSLKDLYAATVSDIWQTVEAAFGACRLLDGWEEPHGVLDYAHFSLLDLAADGARDEADKAYWRDRLIHALGMRTMYLNDVCPLLDDVCARVKKQDEEQAAGLRDKLGELLSGSIPATMADVPPEQMH